MFISGEPGIGKSRLALEFAREVERNGALTLFGRCEEDPLVSYEPFAQVLQQLASRMPPVGDAGDTAARMTLADLVPALSRAPGGAEPVTSDPGMRRLLLFEGTRAALQSAATRTPLLLVLDDLHWAATDTLRLVRYLLRERWDTPALILGLFRDTEQNSSAGPLREAIADLHGDGTVEHLELFPIDDAAVRSYAGERLARELTAVEAGRIVAATGGNPFFVREIVAAMRPGAVDSPPPVAARDMIVSWLARLSPACRTLLGEAAILSEQAEVAVLRALWDGAEEAFGVAVGEAVQSGLLAEGDAHFRFSHGMVQQVLLREIALPVRQQLHLRAARAIAAGRARYAGGYPVAVATHYRKAGDAAPVDEALAPALAAAEAALAGYALDEAVSWWEWALSLMEAAGSEPGAMADLLERMAGILDTSREQSRATAYLQRALHLRKESGDAVETAIAQSRLGGAYAIGNLRTTDLVKARTCFELALPQLTRSSGRRLAAFHSNWAIMGVSSFLLDDLRHAIPASELARSLGWEALAPGNQVALAMLSYHSGDISEGLHLTEEARRQARARGDVVMSGVAAFVGAIAAQRFGDPRLACEQLRPELDGWPAPAIAAPWGLAPRLISALADAGEIAAIRAFARKHTDRDSERIEVLVEQSAMAFYRGDWYDPVWAEAAALAEGAAQRDDRCSCHNLRQWLVSALRVRGERREAIALFEKERDAALSAGSLSQEFVARAELALLHAEAGAGAEALENLARCRQILPVAAARRGLQGKLLLAEALLNAAAGGADPANPTFERALETFRRYSVPWLEARALEDWSAVFGRARRRSNAAALRSKAAALYECIEAGQPWLDRLAAMAHPNGAGAGTAELPDGLTVREADVLRLIARGGSNRQIAEELVLSVRTVERHIANIYEKAGLHTRSQATAYAFRHHLN